MMKVKDSYNVGRLAQVAASEALADQEYFQETRGRIVVTRERLVGELRRLGFSVPPSHANFVFAVPPRGTTAPSLYKRLLAKGFLVRHLDTDPVADGLRISIGTEEDMAGLTRAIQEEISGDQ
jgi:histidinol-phosphate aminotransferase